MKATRGMLFVRMKTLIETLCKYHSRQERRKSYRWDKKIWVMNAANEVATAVNGIVHETTGKQWVIYHSSRWCRAYKLDWPGCCSLWHYTGLRRNILLEYKAYGPHLPGRIYTANTQSVSFQNDNKWSKSLHSTVQCIKYEQRADDRSVTIGEVRKC